MTLSDGGRLRYGALALAPGARPRMPPIDGIGLDGVFSLRTSADARLLRERLHRSADVVVVGGGFIGLEIAATARLLGKTVTVLEAVDRLMGRVVAPEISRHFLDAPPRLGKRHPAEHAGRADHRRGWPGGRGRDRRRATGSPPTSW